MEISGCKSWQVWGWMDHGLLRFAFYNGEAAQSLSILFRLTATIF